MHLLRQSWTQALLRLHPRCRRTYPRCHPAHWSRQQPVRHMIPLQPQSRKGAALTLGELNRQQEVGTLRVLPFRGNIQTSTGVWHCKQLSALN